MTNTNRTDTPGNFTTDKEGAEQSSSKGGNAQSGNPRGTSEKSTQSDNKSETAKTDPKRDDQDDNKGSQKSMGAAHTKKM